MKAHGERAHSKFSASGAERWVECSASVAASEGLPDKENEWSKEGTLAHECLEKIMLALIAHPKAQVAPMFYKTTGVNKEMISHAHNAAKFMLNLGQKLDAEVLVETRIYLTFIHEEMFGTFDGAVVDHFGVLHVFDFKYGKSMVRAKENLQMIFYGIGLAHKFHWNFKSVRLWIIQPRVKGYDGPSYWDVPIDELRKYIDVFTEAVWRVENKPEFKAGDHCHWCKAKKTKRCPLTYEDRSKKAVDLFKLNPITTEKESHGKEEKSKESKASGKDRKKAKGKSEAEVKKEKRRLAKKGWVSVDEFSRVRALDDQYFLDGDY